MNALIQVEEQHVEIAQHFPRQPVGRSCRHDGSQLLQRARHRVGGTRVNQRQQSPHATKVLNQPDRRHDTAFRYRPGRADLVITRRVPDQIGIGTDRLGRLHDDVELGVALDRPMRGVR